MSARLVLGPLLRHVGETDAVVWVETDAACEVEVLGTRARTFNVEGHHYALVRVLALAPSSTHAYEVALDGERAWPPADPAQPPSLIRTSPRPAPLRLAFGSCRVALPHEEPWTLPADEDARGHEVDALYAMARRMRHEPEDRWPDLLLALGDQVYADEVSPRTLEMIRRRRDTSEPPGERIADFDEYTCLYQEAWSDPTVRWLLSTVPSVMIFDDHDIHDDWNISEEWVAQMRTEPWWDAHVTGGLMAYWLYQHLGNLSPDEQDADETLARVRAAEDGAPILREYVRRADRQAEGTRWSYARDLAGARLVVIDSRAGRVLADGRRDMLDDGEWGWLEETAVGGRDHLLLATSLPWLLAPSMHGLEAWSEAVAAGAWGRRASAVAERIRRALDLEHWAAFERSFRRLAELQRAVGAGERGTAPRTIVTLSGDVHHAYLARVAYRRSARVRSAVFQAVCSPVRNPLERRERAVMRFAATRLAGRIGRLLARAAGVPDPPVRWRLEHRRPWFNNQVATLDIDGPHMTFRLERAMPDAEEPRLETVIERAMS